MICRSTSAFAADEEIVITRHGRPAGVLFGFASDEDWFEYRLEHHPEFLRRIEKARAALRAGQGIHYERSGNRRSGGGAAWASGLPVAFGR